MDYFGTPYPKDNPAPIYIGTTRVATPVGEPCIHCGKKIKERDNGFMIPFWGSDIQTIEPWHRRCFHEATLGPELLRIAEEENNEPLD